MKENYMLKYVNSKGEVETREPKERIITIIFAGLKFFFDRILALIGLIILSPLMLLIAIAIKIDSKGPILFKQTRTGKGGKNFQMMKFRTMHQDNDVHDFSKADQHTRVGKILRKTSLDELPQLINIMRGDMSFIGPRPWITDYFDAMNETQRHRYCVRPGITGLAQAMGRNDLDIFTKIKYDLEYIENYSFKMDLKVIFLTIKAVFTGKGADAGKNTIQKELEDLRRHNNLKQM